MVALNTPAAPVALPTVANCPAALVHLEVVADPRGGWTLAEPVDATTGTLRIYRGNWARRRDAQRALESKFSYHAR